ncbi:MAG: J domain-containing protein [Synechococcaceae cyanobacterium]
MPSSFDGPSDDGPSHYELLQLPPNADAQELRQAFRRLSKRYHPDTTPLPADQAQEAFRRLQQAYAVLSDPQARRAYDNRRRAALPLPVPPLQTPPPLPRRMAEPRPVPVRRALSGGEWFALSLLAVALVLSMVLGIGVAWARGAELVRQPSWWPQLQAQAATAAAAALATPSPSPTPDVLGKESPAPMDALVLAGLAARPGDPQAEPIAPGAAPPPQRRAGPSPHAAASAATDPRPPIPTPPEAAGIARSPSPA